LHALGVPFRVLGLPFYAVGLPFYALGRPLRVLGHPLHTLGVPLHALSRAIPTPGHPFATDLPLPLILPLRHARQEIHLHRDGSASEGGIAGATKSKDPVQLRRIRFGQGGRSGIERDPSTPWLVPRPCAQDDTVLRAVAIRGIVSR